MLIAVASLVFLLIPAQAPNEIEVCYLEVVQRYADYMIQYGKDVYGTVHSPLFASALKRQSSSYQLLEPPFPEIEGVSIAHRVLTGANPMHDENLYRLLYALAEVIGDRTYEQAADEALKWFFTHTQSKQTGLFTWGEHLGWDFLTEGPLSNIKQGENTFFIHEFWRPWVLWRKCYALAPEACEQFARGLCDHQIRDHETGNFSRHAYYDRHFAGRNHEYPRHAGFYIATWGEAYAHTRDPFFLQAIETLVDYFENRRHPKTGALPSASAHPEITWPFNELSYAVSVWETACKVPEPLAIKLCQAAERTDDVFTQIPHQLGRQGGGFVIVAETDTLQSPEIHRKRPFSQLWATRGSDARRAMLVWVRYQQTPSKKYRQLIIATAERYLAVDTPNGTLFPGTFGAAISLLVRANRLIGDNRFLQRADELAKQAVRLFWRTHPLPHASSRHDHYESLTKADTLAVALLELWAAIEGKGCPEQHERRYPWIELKWVDR